MKACFVIMPFGLPFDDNYKFLKSNLRLEEVKTIRADEIYTNKPIINDIIEQIIRSDFIIADVTNKNPNVNYELGISHALRKQVIIISQNVDDIPFDYKHLRTIIYDISKNNWQKIFYRKLLKTIQSIYKNPFQIFSINSLDEYYRKFSEINLFGLQNVFTSRQSMNIYLNNIWDKPLKRLDIIAFGLKSFRNFRADQIKIKLAEGLIIRILTLHPNSSFLKQREIDENVSNQSIQKTIFDLIYWAKEMNKKLKKKCVKIKFYNSLPLDFYWSQDENLFVGPYLHGIDSQQTITYHFSHKSYIGKFYSNYFNNIWNDKKFSSYLL